MKYIVISSRFHRFLLFDLFNIYIQTSATFRELNFARIDFPKKIFKTIFQFSRELFFKYFARFIFNREFNQKEYFC